MAICLSLPLSLTQTPDIRYALSDSRNPMYEGLLVDKLKIVANTLREFLLFFYVLYVLHTIHCQHFNRIFSNRIKRINKISLETINCYNLFTSVWFFLALLALLSLSIRLRFLLYIFLQKIVNIILIFRIKNVFKIRLVLFGYPI